MATIDMKTIAPELKAGTSAYKQRWERERMKDPSYRQARADAQRLRYATDPTFREYQLRDKRERAASKYNGDAEARQALKGASKKYAAKLRSDILAAYGPHCRKCGEADQDVLVLDHVFDDGAEARRTFGDRLAEWRHLRDMNFPQGRHQVLCANCNQKKEMQRKRAL